MTFVHDLMKMFLILKKNMYNSGLWHNYVHVAIYIYI